jgi:hypothetical protein
MKDLLFDADADVWVPAPPALHAPDYGLTEEEWAAETAPLLWQGYRHRKRDVERTQRLLLLAGRRDYPSPESRWAVKYIHLPEPDGTPIPAVAAYLPPDGDRDETLRVLVRDGDTSCVEPPIVEAVETPVGVALRSLAYHVNPAPTGEELLLATLSYAWRVEHPDQWDDVTDVRLWAGGTPDQIIALAEDLERLAKSLSWAELKVAER